MGMVSGVQNGLVQMNAEIVDMKADVKGIRKQNRSTLDVVIGSKLPPLTKQDEEQL